LPTTEHIAAHSSIEALWPCYPASHILEDLMLPPTFFSNTPAATTPMCNCQHHPYSGHIDVLYPWTHWIIKRGLCHLHFPTSNTIANMPADPLPPT
jgi:hypothetical protein